MGIKITIDKKIRGFHLLLTATVLLMASTGLEAQEEDFNLAGISYTLYPAVGLKNPANQQLTDTEIDLQEFRAFILVPFRLENENTVLLAGADYTFLGGPLKELPGDRSVSANLHAIRLTGGIQQKLGDHWGVRAMISPTFASDLSGNLGGDAFTLQASALIRRMSGQAYTYGLGLAYTNGFGEPQLVPIAEFTYRSDRVDVAVLAPVQAAFRYHLDKVVLGFRVELQGNEYALDIADTAGNLGQVESLKFSRYNIGPTVSTDLTDALRLQLSGGLSLKRKLTATLADASSEDYGLESGAFLKASLLLVK